MHPHWATFRAEGWTDEQEAAEWARLAADRQERRTLEWEDRIVPRRFRSVTLDTTRTRVSAATMAELDAWVARAGDLEAAGGLVLIGPVGTGKTSAALAVARESFIAGADALYVSAPAFLESLRPGASPASMGGFWYEEPPDPLTTASTVPLLVLDDLGAENPTPWALDRLGALVNARWENCRPTIVTSNARLADLPPSYQRIADRLRDGAVGIALDGESQRHGRRPEAPVLRAVSGSDVR